MARVLIGWELGAGNGHVARLITVAAELKRRGHQPVLAVQNIAAFPDDHEVWQAPLWPALLSARGRGRRISPASFGDILVALGLDEPGALPAILRSWDRMLTAIAPDVVAAEFAPALLMAARGRVPTLLFGSGFGTPPARMPTFPSLTGDMPVFEERPLVAVANRAMAAIGRPPLPTLPAMFAADCTLVEVFRELDPYRAWRGAADYSSPHLSGLAPVVDGTGEEVFVYLNGVQAALDAFVGGLVDSGLPIRLYNPRLSDGEVAALERLGIACERHPLAFARIAERSRLVVSHGGLGFTCAALCAGLPHVTAPFDIEKRLTGAMLEQMGLGRAIAFKGVEREAVATLVSDAYADAAMAHRAIEAAPAFRSRAEPPSALRVADTIDTLLVQ